MLCCVAACNLFIIMGMNDHDQKSKYAQTICIIRVSGIPALVWHKTVAQRWLQLVFSWLPWLNMLSKPSVVHCMHLILQRLLASKPLCLNSTDTTPGHIRVVQLNHKPTLDPRNLAYTSVTPMFRLTGSLSRSSEASHLRSSTLSALCKSCWACLSAAMSHPCLDVSATGQVPQAPSRLAPPGAVLDTARSYIGAAQYICIISISCHMYNSYLVLSTEYWALNPEYWVQITKCWVLSMYWVQFCICNTHNHHIEEWTHEYHQRRSTLMIACIKSVRPHKDSRPGSLLHRPWAYYSEIFCVRLCTGFQLMCT